MTGVGDTLLHSCVSLPHVDQVYVKLPCIELCCSDTEYLELFKKNGELLCGLNLCSLFQVIWSVINGAFCSHKVL